MAILHYVIALAALGFCGHAYAQEVPAVSNSMLQGLGFEADTTKPVAPTRPDTTQYNSADRLDTVRTSVTTNASIAPGDSVVTPVPTRSQAAPTAADNAQARIGRISGRLLVNQNGKNEPVEFASVGLFRLADSTSVTGALTDEKGAFQIASVPAGTFYLLVQSLGFEAKRIPRLAISADKPDVNLGNIILAETARQLKEVTVQGQKEAYEYSLDRKIVNVDQLPVATGGSAVDILQNVPSVTIDVDGSLSLRGSANVIVLVDGKPSGLTGLDRQAILEQIPASNIERIEVITNPSSRYDADGAAGIINIVLKKERASGFNGNVQLNVGTRDKYNAAINLNSRFKKFNLFSSYNFRQERRFSYRNSERQNIFEDSISYLNQRNDAIRRNVNHNLRFGVDYNLTDRDNLTASIMYRNQYGLDTETEVVNTLSNSQVPLGQSIRANRESDPSTGLDYVFGYRRSFDKKGREFTFDATLSTNKGIEQQNFDQTTTLPEAIRPPLLRIGQQRATNERDNQVAVLQADFIEPLGEKKRLETGLKHTFRHLGTNYIFENGENGFWTPDVNLSNNFIYDERTSAAYVNFGNEMKKFSYQLGLRTEYTSINADQRITNQQNKRDYIYLFPSAFVNYNLSQSQKLQVNYTRRINRPSVWSLNPFIDLSDPLNIQFGNPNLSPELINSFELSHLWYGKSTSVTSSLFYRQTINEVTRFRTLRPDGITEQTFLNLNKSQNYGLELVVNQDILKWWKVNGNFSFFQRTIQSSPDLPGVLTRTNRSWTARLTSNMSPKKGTDLQVLLNYRSPFIVAQGTIKGFFNVDLGVKQDVLKGRGTINLRVSDIFNTLRFQNESFGTNFVSSTVNKRESRIAFIGFSYRLSRQISRDRDDRDKKENSESAGESEF
ncbi:outer membrane beta-barrel family protein [Tellurirhabdus bombi]|uniref:outer membrane beta-barrel family protein n=1 Tax=Tellurirhabdus bombi TaxID=2907205 RepID=UPI001F1952DA|nr:outer membrane beta-barrel family protein [Tellurirhabdus bombi]